MKLKKGDTVKVLSGNDKGKSGEILEVMPKKNKVIVKDVNAIDASNVAIVCPKCGKPARIGYKVEGDSKVRICKNCKAELKK